jgi:hypothetical protein
MKTIRFLAPARRELLAEVLNYNEIEVGSVKLLNYQVLSSQQFIELGSWSSESFTSPV